MDDATRARINLAEAFRAHGDFEMEKRAREGYYGDFTSPLAFPMLQLVEDCRAKGYIRIAERAMNGEFDG